ncbi:MAG: hypothetical protein JJ992_02870 [Planctomycetes bacterium]|nr:hypothetical protein [Planctomycetota bacterium]
MIATEPILPSYTANVKRSDIRSSDDDDGMYHCKLHFDMLDVATCSEPGTRSSS